MQLANNVLQIRTLRPDLYFSADEESICFVTSFQNFRAPSMAPQLSRTIRLHSRICE